MANVQRMQHISFRAADAICSAIAFTIACASLKSLQSVFLHQMPGVLREIHRFISGSATGLLPAWTDLVWIGIVVTLAFSITLEYGHDAKPVSMRSKAQIIFLPLIGVAVAGAVVSTFLYALHVPLYSRLFIFSYLAYLFTLTAGYRLLFRAALLRRERRGKATLRIVICGTPAGVQLYLNNALKDLVPHTEVVGCLFPGEPPISTAATLPILGNVSELGDLLVHEPIDEVVIVLPNGDTPWLGTMLQSCDYFRVSAHIVFEAMFGVALRDLTATHTVQQIPAMTFIPEEDSLNDRLAWKRLVDFILSACALIVLAPIMILIAILIKITTPDLPIFYHWRVVGYRGRHFTGYKFTTMVADADQQKEALAHLNEMQGPVFKIKNDPRMTPIGKFLRKYSLNELPQFWSVLVGDMSLVGPRPASPNELKRYQLWHKRKLSVRPGITCYWQVRGRNAITSFDDWVKMDLEYIENRSMRTDAFILLQTVKAVFSGSGS